MDANERSIGMEACVQIGLRSEIVGINRLKPEELPGRYWRWAEAKPAEKVEQVDGVELSLRARWMSQLMAHNDAPVRSDRIEQIRADLRNGTYDTPTKLERALDRMIDDVQSI
jgi:anti-sigma28 factor (negative regulator of flagellin synthesis)